MRKQSKVEKAGVELGEAWAGRASWDELQALGRSAADPRAWDTADEPGVGWANYVLRMTMTEEEWNAPTLEEKAEITLAMMFGERAESVTRDLARDFAEGVRRVYEQLDEVADRGRSHARAR